MILRDLVNEDIYDNALIDIIGDNIYYYEKPEGDESYCYIEWQLLSSNRGEYSANEHNTLEGNIQVNIYSMNI